MKDKLPLILILGGVAIATIAWFGSKSAKTKSDAEIIQEAILAQQDIQRQQRENKAALMRKVLPAPTSCIDLKTKFIFDICELEPYPGEPWPDWANNINQLQESCIVDAFHQTNIHAFAIKDEIYEQAAPEIGRLSTFVSDLCSAALFTDGVDYGDADKPASDLIAGYYADRAESRVKPAHDY